MITAILVILILAYAGFIIYRKVKDFKAGRYCSGCSGGCSGGSCGKCPSLSNDKRISK